MATTGSHTSNPAGSPKIKPVPSDQKPEEFARFEKLTRKIAQVPKSEVDAKREKG